MQMSEYIKISDYEALLADVRQIVREECKAIADKLKAEDEPKEMLTGRELARRLGVSNVTISRYASAGKIPFVRAKNSRNKRYILAEVVQAMKDKNVEGMYDFVKKVGQMCKN